ncbi:MAG: ATP-binding protein [Clostridia bacterium]|nr:ATP-binding protein [Clostridia bacterium]
MSTAPRKKNIIFIGVIVFVSISILGILFDVILNKKGMIAIPAVAVAFLSLAVFFLVEWLMRKRSEPKVTKNDNDYYYSEDEVPNEQRFLRHQQSEDDYDEDYDEDYEDDWQDASLDDMPPVDDDDFQPAPMQPRGRFGGVFKKRDQSENQISAAISDEDPDFGRTDSSDFGDDNFDDDSFDDDDFRNEPQEDFLKPVMVIGAPGEIIEPSNETKEEPASQVQPAQDDFEQTADAGTLDQPAAEDEAASENDEEQFEQIEPQNFAEATGAVAVATASAGQTLESFYDTMSEEDILYRDCVEVWAADAKPYILRMIKYIEGIEDKQTQALFGKECEYINAMLDRIYAFTELQYIDEMLEPKQYVFSTLVKECLKRFSPFFMEKKIGLLWKGLDINIVVDKRWFIFALTQVLFNAVEFTEEGGKIAISAKRSGDFIDLIVDDSGKGISPEEMPYIFIAGYMGDESPNEDGRRTGMGLFIAKSVINKMGGDVFAESSPGKGTRITIHLPAGCEE